MADQEWVSTDGNWNAAGSWTSAVPLDGDNVYFTGASIVNVTSGLILATGGDALASLNVGKGYTGSIGASGGSLVTDAITVLRFVSEGGKLFLDSEAATVTDTIIESQRGLSDMLQLDGVFTNVDITRCAGKVIIAAGATVTNVNMIASPSCTLVTTAGASGLALVRMDSGIWESNAAISTGVGHVLQYGGTIKHTIGAITLLHVLNGGQYIHTASETITSLIGSGQKSRFDGRTNRKLPNVTLTNASGYDGFQLLLKNSNNSYVITNGYKNFTGNSVFETGLPITKS